MANKKPAKKTKAASPARSGSVTERKLREDEFCATEEQFRSLVENMPDVTWRADAEGLLVYISPNVRRVCGYEPGELLGQSMFSRIHPENVAEVRKRYGLLFAKGR